MKRKNLIIAMTFVCAIMGSFFVQLYACGPIPTLTCLQVNANGSVVLNWLNPPSTLNFSKYYIYRSNQKGGPYQLVDSINNTLTLSYTDLHVNANTGPFWYTMKTDCGGGVSNPSNDTVNTMALKLNVIGNGGIAQLNWNPLQIVTPVAGLYYQVYRGFPKGTWTLVDSTQALTALDTIPLCKGHIDYKIQIKDPTGCQHISDVIGGVFSNGLVPAVPFLDSVSVNSQGFTAVGWHPSNTKNTIGYVVYKFVNGAWMGVDTNKGRMNTFFVNKSSTPSAGVESYRIASFDSCQNICPLGPVHNTLLITAIPNPCYHEVALSWNKYNNMGSGIKSYNLEVSTNGGPMVLLAKLPADSFNFVHQHLIQNDTYVYQVVAYDQSGTRSSTSPKYVYKAITTIEPKFSYLAAVSVVNGSQVQLTAFVDTSAQVNGYKVMRSTSMNGPFAQVGYIPFTHKPLVYFLDSTTQTSQNVLFYQTIAVDNCLMDTTHSQVSNTVLLQGQANDNNTNKIAWNTYGTWLGGVGGFQIYRAVDSVWGSTPIATIPFNATGYYSYLDDVSAFFQSKGDFQYEIVAFEGAINQYNLLDSSRSNRLQLLQEDNIYIPNAFAPNGSNKVFIPKGEFFDENDIELIIFDRWGQELFHASNSLKGWDGKINNGPLAEQGIYVYLLRYKSSNGLYKTKKGSVLLIK